MKIDSTWSKCNTKADLDTIAEFLENENFYVKRTSMELEASKKIKPRVFKEIQIDIWVEDMGNMRVFHFHELDNGSKAFSQESDMKEYFISQIEKMVGYEDSYNSPFFVRDKNKFKSEGEDDRKPKVSTTRSRAAKASGGKCFCRKCGASIPEDSVFCPKCGAKQ